MKDSPQKPLRRVRRILQLFSVQLPWNPNDAEEGTYYATVWATGADAAEKLVAKEMAAQSQDSARGRKGYYNDLLNSGKSVVFLVVDDVEENLRTLFAGPKKRLSLADSKLVEALISQIQARNPR